MLEEVLCQFGFSNKEAKVYLVCLELGAAPASTIARNLGENRVTVYSVLNSLCKKGLATEILKNNIKYYSVLEPEKLIKTQELKFEKLKESLPHFTYLLNSQGTKPKVFFYEGIESLKTLFKEIILESDNMPKDECFYTFLGTKEIDPIFQRYLTDEFVPFRLNYKTKTKAIISNKNATSYSIYNQDYHDSVVIDNDLFEMSNEIVMFGTAKVAILMYSSSELSGLVIESKTLYNSLKGLFNFIWSNYKK